jgi:catechol 2,3-dioxygenase-like lactoylglutathione lyase family enzyme
MFLSVNGTAQSYGVIPETLAHADGATVAGALFRGRVRSDNRTRVGRVTLQRMDNVGIVVESLDAAIPFFAELGLELEGRATIEGEWAGRVTGLGDQRVEIAMMRTPDGHSRLELSRFLTPPVVADHRNAPVNALGYLRVMFAVDDLDDTLARLREHGAQLVGEVVQYEDVYRLCYIRGPEGLLIGLAEQIG